MKTHYIVYYEGMNASGNAVMNGNMALDSENLTEAGELLNYILEYSLAEAQKSNPNVTRMVIKGVFKL